MSTRTKDYILTESGNHISRKGLNLVHTQSIVLGGKTILESSVTIRGDLKRVAPPQKNARGPEGAVNIGRYCVLRHSCQLIPPHKIKQLTTPPDSSTSLADHAITTPEKVYYPMKIGDYVDIGVSSIVESANIASYVHVGARCKLGNMSIIKEGSIIEDDSEVAPYTVVAPFSRVSGRPGLVVGETPEVMCDLMREALREHYTQVVSHGKH